MKLESIVTLANRKVRTPLLALERSLRAVGCTLPLRVIPYDDERFDLPPNASWWIEPRIHDWLAGCGAHPTMRKYQCLTIGNYQFIDTDAVFLQNPVTALARYSGFVTCCGHWRNTDHATTPELIARLARRSTTWQRWIFNTGQFASDRPLYNIEQLVTLAERPDCRSTCLDFLHHEQPGLNLLVTESGVSITNLTLPPTNLESSWAGDYASDFRSFWDDPATMPYLMHWAGTSITDDRPINQLIYQYLDAAELEDLRLKMRRDGSKSRGVRARICSLFRRLQ